MKKKQIKRIIIGSVACVAGLGTILGQGLMINNRNMVIEKMNAKVLEVKHQVDEANKTIGIYERNEENLNNTITALQKEKTELVEANRLNLQKISSLQEVNATLKKNKEERSRVKQDSPQKASRRSVKQTSSARQITVEVSGYCTCYECSEGWGSQTADGHGVSWGVIAAPREIPFGTKMKIDGFDTIFTVHDRGGYIKKVGNVYRIDVWFPTHQQAERYGRRTVSATILE